MASSISLYNSLLKYLADGTVNLNTDTIKVALVDSGYSFAATDDIWGDVSADEVAAGDGYTTGGETLANQAVSLTDSPAKSKFDADDLVWTALTKVFRFGIIYAVKSVGSPAVVNPLIACILFDTAPADITVSGVDFTIQWNASGIITLS